MGVLRATTAREEEVGEPDPGARQGELEVLEQRGSRTLGGRANEVVFREGTGEEGVDVGLEGGDINLQAMDPESKALVGAGDRSKAGRRGVGDLGLAEELDGAEVVGESASFLGAGAGAASLANLSGVEGRLFEERADLARGEGGQVGVTVPAFPEHLEEVVDLPGGDTGIAVGVGPADFGNHGHRVVIRGTPEVGLPEGVGCVARDAGGDTSVRDDRDVGVDIEDGAIRLGVASVDPIEAGTTGSVGALSHEGVGGTGLEDLQEGVAGENPAPSREGGACQCTLLGVEGIGLQILHKVEVAAEESVHVRGLREKRVKLLEFGTKASRVAARGEVEVESLEGTMAGGGEGGEADDLDRALVAPAGE